MRTLIASTLIASTSIVLAATSVSAYTCKNTIENVNGFVVYTSSVCGSTAEVANYFNNKDDLASSTTTDKVSVASPTLLMSMTVTANTPDKAEPEPETQAAPVAPAPMPVRYDLNANVAALEASLAGLSTQAKRDSLLQTIESAKLHYVATWKANLLDDIIHAGDEAAENNFYFRSEGATREYSQQITVQYTQVSAHEELFNTNDRGHESIVAIINTYD